MIDVNVNVEVDARKKFVTAVKLPRQNWGRLFGTIGGKCYRQL